MAKESNIWFTADLHFGHDKIIEYCNRPFKNASVMDKQLIRNWNECVEEEDVVYVVGDFCLKTAAHRGYFEGIMQKLKGTKILIPGNHEVDKYTFYCGDRGIGFLSIHYPYLEVGQFIVCHDPALSVVDRKKWFICGHVHDLFHIFKNVFNVGVDVNDYKPVSIYEITTRIGNIEL